LGWFGCANGRVRNTLKILEKVAYTMPLTDAFMQLQLIGELHDIP
jgi:hypothetical protein